MEPKLARYIWQLIEPYHALVYFSPKAIEVYERAGFKGGWMAYFAGRAGGMGAVGAEVVIATFFNFHPDMVRRAIPDAWKYSSPEKALAAREELADTTIRMLLGDEPAVGDAPDLLTRVVEASEPAGRPLFAANAHLDRPESPRLHLWWACTTLREHRGDGHVACLTRAGLDGLEAHVMSAAIGAVKPSTMLKFRGWSEDDWAAAAERLRSKGLLDEASGLTPEGGRLKQEIEDDTDRLAAGPFEVLSDTEIDRLLSTLEPLTAPLVALTSYPNPMGLTRPERPV